MRGAGVVIVLNGPSSVGKSSVARAIQTLSAEPYLDAGLDRFLFMLPSRYRERPEWDDVLGRNIRAGSTGHRLVRGMHRSIAAMAVAGWNVVADHVLVERDWALDIAAVLGSLNAYLVGLRCPLEVLEQRERDRRDRTLGQAREQFDAVHAHVAYDLEIDTSTCSADDAARTILGHAANAPPRALRAFPA